MQSTTSTPQRPLKTLRALGKLRQRLRQLYLVSGLTRMALAVVLAASLSFGLDFLLDLPVEVRTFHVLVAVGVVLFLLLRWVVHPLTRNVSDQELASLVEENNPELKQSLITAVELSRPKSESALYVSGDLLTAVVEDVERETRGVLYRRVFRLGGLKRNLAALVALLAVFVVGAANSPQLLAIWIRRDLLLQDERWPKSTMLELDPSTPLLVAKGDNLTVAVRLLRGRPPAVLIEKTERGRTGRARGMRFLEGSTWDVFVEPGDDPRRVREVLAELGFSEEPGGRVAYGLKEQEAEQVKANLESRLDAVTVSLRGYDAFWHNFERNDEDFSFVVRGGDATLGPVSVRVLVRPRIDMGKVRIKFEYPEYTGKQDEEIRPQRHTNIKVPVGTRVSYVMGTNIPVAKGFFVLRESGQPEDGASSEPGDLRDGTGGVWPDLGAVALDVRTTVDEETGERRSEYGGNFVVESSGFYYFQFESESGLRSGKPERFRVQAIPDRKPQVRIVEPDRITEEVSPDAAVTVRVYLKDDYGVRSGVLEGVYFPPASEKGVPQSIPLPGLAAASPRQARAEHNVAMTLNVAQLKTDTGKKPEPGGRFEFFAIGEDFGETGRTRDDGSPVGNIGESQAHLLQIVDKAALERLLTDQIMVVRDQLRDILNRQGAVRKDLEEFQAQMMLGGTIPSEEAHKLSRHRQEQNRITEGLERQVQDMDRVLAKMEANAVGDEQWKSWVKGIRGEVEDLAQTQSGAVENELEELRRETLATPQETTRLGPITASQRQIERDLRALVVKLSDFGERSALIQLLRDLRTRQAELRDRTREQVKDDE